MRRCYFELVRVGTRN